jgi:hypothetical protein
MIETMPGQQAETTGKAFRIKDCALIALTTGRRAHTLRELAEELAHVPTDCLYAHFWGRLLQSRFEEPEYANDFAAWAEHALHDKRLAERLAIVDPTATPQLEDLREALLEVLAERLDEDDASPWTRAAYPFDLLQSQIVVFDTRHRMTEPEDLADELPKLSPGSVFYHFIDSRRRLDNRGDDVGEWLAQFGPRYEPLRRRIAAVDPTFATLSEFQADLVAVAAACFGRDP